MRRWALLTFFLTATFFAGYALGLPAVLSVSSPTFIYAGQNATYLSTYAGINESENPPLTPFDHNSSCQINTSETTSAMQFNETLDAFTASIGFSAIGTYPVTIACSAPDYDFISMDIAQEVQPLPSLISYIAAQSTEFGTPAEFTVFFNSFFLENNTLYNLSPREHNASCLIYIDEDLPIQLEYNETGQTFEFTATLDAGDHSETIICSAPNYEDAIAENIHEVTPAPTQLMPRENTRDSNVTLGVIYDKFYAENIFSPFSDTDGASCSALIYNNETGILLQEVDLTYNSEKMGEFQATIELAPGAYYWGVSCYGVPNYQEITLLRAGEFVMDEPACFRTAVTNQLELTSDKSCSTDNEDHVYAIVTDNARLQCNGFTLSGLGSGERVPIGVQNAANATIENCNVENFASSIGMRNASNVAVTNLSSLNAAYGAYIFDSNNSRFENFNFTATDKAQVIVGIYAYGDSVNNVFSNGVISNYGLAIATTGSNGTLLKNINILDSNVGIVDAEGETNSSWLRIEDVVINNAALPIGLLKSYRATIDNLTIYNSPALPEGYWLPTAAFAINEAQLNNIKIYNSSHNGVLISGSNNVASLSLTEINGTGVTLQGNQFDLINETQNNTIFLTSSNASLDLNITDNSGAIYNNNFIINGSLNSAFFNVTNNSHRIIATFQTTYTTNAITVNYSNLTLFNDTGVVNATNLTSFFTFANTSISLNSSAMPFLSQPATITFNSVTYANTLDFQILKDGALCEAPKCVKVSSQPVVIKVLGFSNYSIQPTPPASLPPATTPTPGGGGTSSGGTGTPSPSTQLTPKQNTTSLTNATNSTTVQNATAKATTAPKPSRTAPQQNATTLQQPAQSTQGNNTTSPFSLTGLFAGIPKEFNSTYAAGVGVLVIALLGTGYYLLKKS